MIHISANENSFITTVNLREDHKIIQALYGQKFSEFVRYLADAMISGAELDKLPPELAEKVVHSRRMAKLRLKNIESINQMKENFFLFLDNERYPNYISRYSRKKAKEIGKEFAIKYSLQNILPECYILPFLNEYYETAIYEGKMIAAYLERQKLNIKCSDENPEVPA